MTPEKIKMDKELSNKIKSIPDLMNDANKWAIIDEHNNILATFRSNGTARAWLSRLKDIYLTNNLRIIKTKWLVED